MINYNIQVEINESKRKEFTQFAKSIVDKISKDEICSSLYITQDINNNNNFCIQSTWETEESLKNFLNSETYKILAGSIRILSENKKIETYSQEKLVIK